ncbi:MAG: Ni/Fe-hydrogenase cytochrome b subunit [Nitrospirota bacterium]
MGEFRPLGGKIVTRPFLVLAAVALFAGVLLVKRFVYGIGAVSNMSDGYPWGIWITYDVVVGTAFACGGYALAMLVYVLNKKTYYPLIRSAILASMFGYTLAGVSIFFDVGRYWQAYNLILPWYSQLSSVMFEVALCVTTYIMVLWIEFAPSFLERWNKERMLKVLRKVLFLFIAVGVLLPTMHQSSLGLLVYIAGQKVSPLWQTGFLPLLFLITSITMGYAIVVFESILSSVGFRRPLETGLLAKLSAIIPKLLALYLVIRFGDLIGRGELGLVFRGDMKSIMFIVENLLYLIPTVILFSPANRERPRMLFIGAVLMLLAGAVYRFNTFLVGFDPGPGWHYFPSFSETMITVGLIAVEIMGYLLFVKTLPVLPSLKHA